MNYIEQKILDGQAVLFLGAGASYNCTNLSGLRIGFTGKELLEKICNKFLNGPQVGITLDVASTLAIEIAGRTEFDQFLKELVGEFEPTEEHELLTKFRWKAIFTTNYDEAIEKAYLNERKNAKQKIEKIICDNDHIQQAYSSVDKLPLIKIHGCITRLNDNSLPLIISRTDYRFHLQNRSGLFQSLKESLCNDLVIFYGYGLNDQNIIGLLDDLDREGKSRTRHLWLDPYMNDLYKSFWQSKNLECRQTPLSIFLNEILEKKKEFHDVQEVMRNDSCISKLIPSHDRPSSELEEYIKHQLIYLDLNSDRQAEFDNYKKELFYRGSSVGFGWVGRNLDFDRSILETLIEDIFVNSEISNKIFNFYLIKGYAGSGKTVLLKRLAWTGVHAKNKPCFYLQDGAELNVNFVINIAKLIKETIYIFVDDILYLQSEIQKISDFSRKNSTKIFVIGTARTNEWNNSTNMLDGFNPITFGLSDLNDREIRSLISKLKENDAEGNLKELSEDDKFNFIKKNSNKQLLVTLLEATHQGQEFSEIIKDEYECIYNRSAKELYLNICSLHRHGVELRAGMIKRLSGIDFERFKDEFLEPLELLVLTYFSYKVKDIVYSSRHQNIAEHVYAQAFFSEVEKAQQLIKIIHYLNISYESDKVALEVILKGKLLASEFNDKKLVDSIYNVASEVGLNQSYLFHQRAIFEANHENGNLSLAMDYIKNINGDDSFYDMRAVNHTRANIYRKMAQRSPSLQDKVKYRGLGLRLLNENIRASHKNSMPYVTKGYLLLDEIKDLSDNDELVIEIVKDFEANLSSGYKKYPYDEALLALEHDFSKEIDSLPKAITKLSDALRKNSDNIFLVKRYAKYYIQKGDYFLARQTMNNFLRNHINNKEINFLMAESYIHENEKVNFNLIIKYLKNSYSSNDNSYYEKFTHARFEYVYGSEDKAYSIFQELIKAPLPAKMKNNEMGLILDDLKREKVFDAFVVTINPDYGFVKCYDYKENIYVHKSAIGDYEAWELLSPNDSVKISIIFTFRGPRVKKISIV
ncbi:SIR2 family NAD-dependent protein deacylase [Acinetobacter haemolyticus]|uniref:SIR2 family protein n=1 Tax=Acinetobacter haemolyticus TaxID=29430 RepID=A0AAW4J5W6_ACIHA|nr:SIR2 family protein [Acinetobacter haemolyticus]MBO3657814.1 SIR2 family protein [Acinetobacter haemolyticus]